MKSYLYILFAVFSNILVAQQQLITPEKEAQITNYINNFEEHNRLLGSLSIFEGDTEVINRSFGIMPASATTKYQIGSITKLFTAVPMAKLVEENKLDFDESLANYFPQMPGAQYITIKTMLNHTSGLKDFVAKQDSLYYWLKKPVQQEEILEEIAHQGLAFKPGDSIAYSNAGYYLLARILEKKYEKSYDAILAEKITQPLELKNTFSLNRESSYDDTAGSYKRKDDNWEPLEEFYFPNVQGVGDIISTPYDLNVFMKNLFDNKLLKPETLSMMLPKKDEWFGMGIMMVPFYDYTAYGHGGDTYGTHSVTSYNPKNKLRITYIINGEDYPTNEFAIGLLSIIYDKEYKLPQLKEYTPKRSFYKTYAGTYTATDFPIKIKIYEEGTVLMAQGEGQPALELSPVAEHTFEFLKAGLTIQFDPYAETLLLKQGGQEFKLKKE